MENQVLFKSVVELAVNEYKLRLQEHLEATIAELQIKLDKDIVKVNDAVKTLNYASGEETIKTLVKCGVLQKDKLNELLELINKSNNT